MLDVVGDTLATTFCDSVDDLEGEALVFTMHHILTEAKVETPSDTLGMWRLRHRRTRWLTGSQR